MHTPNRVNSSHAADESYYGIYELHRRVSILGRTEQQQKCFCFFGMAHQASCSGLLCVLICRVSSRRGERAERRACGDKYSKEQRDESGTRLWTKCCLLLDNNWWKGQRNMSATSQLSVLKGTVHSQQVSFLSPGVLFIQFRLFWCGLPWRCVFLLSDVMGLDGTRWG